KVSFGKAEDYFCYGNAADKLLYMLTPKSWIEDMHRKLRASSTLTWKDKLAARAIKNVQFVRWETNYLTLFFKSSVSNTPVNLIIFPEDPDLGQFGPAYLDGTGSFDLGWRGGWSAAATHHYGIVTGFPR